MCERKCIQDIKEVNILNFYKNLLFYINYDRNSKDYHFHYFKLITFLNVKNFNLTVLFRNLYVFIIGQNFDLLIFDLLRIYQKSLDFHNF